MLRKAAIFLCIFVSQTTLAIMLPQVLLVSFDGFRYDLLNASTTPNMFAFVQQGVHFKKGLRSQYATYTAPNHASIATGLYEDAHGIVGNTFWDAAAKLKYDVFNVTGAGLSNASLEERWYKGEPIWLTNERADREARRSASMFFPLGEAKWPSEPHFPTLHRQWNGYKNFTTLTENVDEIVQLFTNTEKPFNFVAWYVAEPDHTLHQFGFYTGDLRKKLTELDELWKYLMDKLDSSGLAKTLNVILTADHGHAEINGRDHVICIRDYMSLDGIITAEDMLYVENEQVAEEIVKNLSMIFVTKSIGVEAFPKNYAFADSPRVGAVIFTPKSGWAVNMECTKAILDEQTAKAKKANDTFHSATHGMDPIDPKMHGILGLRGPAFKRNVEFADIPLNVDLYSLMCRVLNITASPNNGTMEILKKALADEPRSWTLPMLDGETLHTTQMQTAVFIVAVIIPSVLLLLFLYKMWRSQSDDPAGRFYTNGGYARLDDGSKMSLTGGSDQKNSSSTKKKQSQRKSALLAEDLQSSDDDF